MGCGACKPQYWAPDAVTVATTTELDNVRSARGVSMQVVFSTAAPTAASIVLEGSNDGVTWTALISMDQTDTASAVESCGIEDNVLPCRLLRVRIHTVTIGSCTGIRAHVVAV